MKIGCDIDGVLYDWDGFVREQASTFHLHGMPHALTEEQEANLWRPGWLGPEQFGEENWNWFWANQNKLRIYLGPRDFGREHWEALSYLSTQHETYLVTSRPRDCWWQTYAWVAGQPPHQLQGIIHADDKVQTAVGLTLDVLVDDRPSQLEAYRSWAITHDLGVAPLVYGVRRPWNSELHQPGVIRWVDGVADLLKEPWV